MNIFGWRKNLAISSQNPVFKVRYLGNVQTSVMKGEGCVDRATNIIWSNHKKNDQAGLEMRIELTGSGMKAHTHDQGLTEYLASRISYCIAHPQYPRLFVWVYRHEGRKSKMELRCHAVLCKNEAKAKAIAFQLCEKLKSALEEFKREKLHLQNSRLVLQKTNSVPKSGNLLPLRTQLLSTAKNFRPPPTRTNSSNKLGAILEDSEREEPPDECVEEEEEEGGEERGHHHRKHNELRGRILRANVSRNGHEVLRQRFSEPPSPSSSAGPATHGLLHRGREHHDILEALDLENSAVAAGSGSSTTNNGGKLGPGREEEGLFGSENGEEDDDDVIDLEFGNDFKELEETAGDVRQFCVHHSENVDSDEESAESGFHDQEASFPESELSVSEGGGGGGGGGVGGGDDSSSEGKSKSPSVRGGKKGGNSCGDVSVSVSVGKKNNVENGERENEEEEEEEKVCAYPSPLDDGSNHSNVVNNKSSSSSLSSSLSSKAVIENTAL